MGRRIIQVVSSDKGSVSWLADKLATGISDDFSCIIINVKEQHWFGLIKLIKAVSNAELVHLHAPIPIALSSMIRILNKKIILIATIHDQGKTYMKYTLPFIKRYILSYFFDLGISKMDKIVFVSNALRDFYKDSGYVLQSPHVIYNTFEIPLYNWKEKDDSKWKIVLIGNQFVAKGFDFIINSLEFLGNYEIHFFGISINQVPKKYQGECLMALKNNSIKFHGYVKLEKILYFIANENSIVAIPSYGEGLPLTALECASIGGLLVVNDLPVFTEFLSENIVKRFVTGDVSSLLVALNNAQKISQSLRNEFALEIRKRFSYENYINAHLEMYNSLF